MSGTLGGLRKSKPLSVSDLSDVRLEGISDGCVLVYNRLRDTWDVGTVAGANELGDMIDVTLEKHPKKGQVLTYNGINWINDESGLTSIADATDTTIRNPSPQQMLVFNGSKWVNQYHQTPPLCNNPDVSIESPSPGQVLAFDGTNWANDSDLSLDGNVTATDVTAHGTLTDGTMKCKAGAVSGVSTFECKGDIDCWADIRGDTITANLGFSDNTLTIAGGNISGAQSIVTDELKVNPDSVSQTDDSNPVVSIHSGAGVITTTKSDVQPGESVTLTVQCERCTSSSVIMVNVCGYNSEGTGIPLASVNNVSDESFDLVVTNASADKPLDSSVQVAFVIH